MLYDTSEQYDDNIVAHCLEYFPWFTCKNHKFFYVCFDKC